MTDLARLQLTMSRPQDDGHGVSVPLVCPTS